MVYQIANIPPPPPLRPSFFFLKEGFSMVFLSPGVMQPTVHIEGHVNLHFKGEKMKLEGRRYRSHVTCFTNETKNIKSHSQSRQQELFFERSNPPFDLTESGLSISRAIGQ